MRYSEQFMEHIEYAFNAFCKVVLRHEAINAWRDLKRKAEREISLDYLMSERYFEITLILAYENNGVESEIKINGDYVMLERIVANAIQNATLHISRSRLLLCIYILKNVKYFSFNDIVAVFKTKFKLPATDRKVRYAFDNGGVMFDKKVEKKVAYHKLMNTGFKEAERIINQQRSEQAITDS